MLKRNKNKCLKYKDPFGTVEKKKAKIATYTKKKILYSLCLRVIYMQLNSHWSEL